MKKNESANWREESWRTAARPEIEKVWQDDGSAHSAAAAERQEERRLTQLLQQLPDAPLPSNFNSQVLQAIARAEAKAAREQKREVPAWWAGFKWVSRLTVAGFVLAAGLLALQQNQVTQQRAQFARSVETVSQIAALPTDWLANFETINRLSQPAPADEELLAMLE